MNFLAPCLSPSVSSSKPCADGYDVHNLVNGYKGFMGAYFIRPPVDITVEFPVPIDISYIKMTARLDQKCSTGFSIFTEPEDIISSQSQNTAGSSQVSSLGDTSTSIDNSNPTVTAPPSDGKDTEIHFCVGKFYTKSEEELVLTNHHYRHWLKLLMPDTKSNTNGQSVFHGSLRHPNRKALKCVKSIIVRIQSTLERGPPVLRLLEVWGQPGITTYKSRRRELLKQWTAYKPTVKAEPNIPRLYNSNPEEVTDKYRYHDLNEGVNSQDSEIPEDFLDPLTCDVMTVPLLLPSGNSIDAHTLERFVASEGTWGRPASDPFTGVPFRANHQPTPNVSLKARIDRFLLANGEHPEVERCGRTVGSSLYSSDGHGVTNKREFREDPKVEVSDDASRRKMSRVEVTSVEEEGRNTQNDDLNMEIEAALKGKPKYLPPNTSVHREKESNEANKGPLFTASHLWKQRSEALRVQTVKNKRDAITRPGQCLPGPESSSSSHHGIVQMIGGILSVTQGRTAKAKRLPAHHANEKPTRLIHGDKPSESYKYSFTCSESCSCGKTEALYKLECEHILCRQCLQKQTNKTEVECATCKRTSKKSAISKHHMKSIFSS